MDKNYENPYKKFKKEEGIKDILNLEKKDNELPPIQLDEIVKKLRAFGVPITFFGETPM